MPPANDNFVNATTISTSLPQDITGLTTLDATDEVGEPAPYFGLGGTEVSHSVWYKFTPTHTATYRISIDNLSLAGGSQPRAQSLGVYTGSAVNALTAVQTTYQSSGASELAIRTQLTSGVTYYIQISNPHFSGEGANDHSFNFDLHVEEITSPGIPPANDDIADAQDLGNDPSGTFSGSNIDATYEAWEGTAGYTQPSVWYKFSIDFTATQTVFLEKTGSDPDWQPYAEIYTVTSDPPADFTDLSFFEYLGDTSFTGTIASTDVDWVPGDYYLVVYNWNFDGSWDDFDLTFQEFSLPPVNDNFANRTHLPYSYKVSVEGTTAGATTEVSEPTNSPGGVGPHPSVWYEWTPPNYNNEPMNFQIDTLGSDAETYLEVFTGTSFFSPLALIASDHNSGAGGKSQLTLNTNGDIVYKIRVSSPLANVGTFNLNITAQPGGSPPANDNFANAILMTGYSDTESGTTVGAIAEADEQGWGDFDETTNSVWYKWVPPQTGRVRVQLDTSGASISLFMARGTTLANLQEIQFFSISTNSSNFDYLTVEGDADYYFVIQGNGGDEGTFSFEFEMANVAIPANDNPATPTIIPFTNVSNTITDTTEGIYFELTGSNPGDFITNAQESGTMWYKLSSVTRHATLQLHVNNDVVFNNDSTSDAALTVWKGNTFAEIEQISPFVNEVSPVDVIVGLEPGQTYWILVNSFYWSTTLSWDYTIQLADSRTDGATEFDSITGTFVEDDDNPGTWVASGGIGYGTVNFDEGHWQAPNGSGVGWWARFEVESSTGEYLYRYGQTQQFIEIFRATREDNTYESICIVGHREGPQTIAYYQNGSQRFDTGHAVWGGHAFGSSSKVRIEVGANGVTIDGTNFFVPTDEGWIDSLNNQFVKFDVGIITYPADGTAYVPLAPEWDIRISDFRIHDNPEIGVMGPADHENQEIISIHGYTTGTLVKHDTNDYPFQVLSVLNSPTVVVSAGEYSDGYSVSMNTNASNVNACGVRFARSQPTDSIFYDPYSDPAYDTSYPGASFRFFIHDTFPDQLMTIASYYGDNGWRLWLDTDGTLLIQPSFQSSLIPFCYVNVNEWNYIEIMGDFHGRPYTSSIWMGNSVFLGEFEEVVFNKRNLNQGPQFTGTLDLGRIFIDDVDVHLEFRDISTTRCKHHRPLGPTIILPKYINGTGLHHYPTIPDEGTLPSGTTIINNGDFTGGVDGAGQPEYWTSYDRFDSSVPPGAMRLDYLGRTIADSICSIVSDGSGPPGLESLPALQIEAVANDQGYETGTAVAYVVGNGAAVEYPIDYADTISMQFWIKGKAGWNVSCYTHSGIGTLDAFESFPIKEDDEWQFMRTFVKPQVVTGGSLNVSDFTLQIDGMSVGEFAYVKDVHVYTNADNNNWYGFWYTTNNGADVLMLQPGEDDSWQLINDFPADSNSDQIYANVQTFLYSLRGAENDGKTHLPGSMYDYYLEYKFQEDNPEEDRQLWGARLLVQGKSYSSNDGRGGEGYDSFGGVTGPRITYANFDNDYRNLGGRDMKSDDFTRWALNMKRPPGLGRWGTEKWNNFRMRFGMHSSFFITSTDIIASFANAGVLEGVMAEILVYDRKLPPPNCIRPVDLSRVRFRAYQDGDA